MLQIDNENEQNYNDKNLRKRITQMEEKNERKLHFIFEIAIIAIIILGCSLAYSAGFASLVAGKSYSEIMSIYYATSWCQLIFPIIATLLCVNVIEKRKVGIIKVLVVTLSITLITSCFWTEISNYVARFGDSLFVSFSYVSRFLSPVLTAILIVVFINILSAPKVDAYLHDKKMHYGLFTHILLLLFTFGIWLLMWNYRVTRYLNCVEDEEYRNPATKLLLCMFVPFYSIYWTYKSAQRIDKLAKFVNVISDLATPCLILEIFVPIIPPILMQDKINKIIETTKR